MEHANDIKSMLNSNAAFFLIENDGTIFEDVATALSQKYSIEDFNNDMDVHIYESQNLQIADIKKIIFEIGLKPYKNVKLMVFKNFEKVGELAQNALLKSIEELPADTKIFAICSNMVNILDTIKSRAYYIYLNNIEVNNTNKEKLLFEDKIQVLCEKDILDVIENKYEKEEVLEWIKNSISTMKDLLKNSLLSERYVTDIMHKIFWAQECYTLINANCNKNLCMDMLLYRILEEK